MSSVKSKSKKKGRQVKFDSRVYRHDEKGEVVYCPCGNPVPIRKITYCSATCSNIYSTGGNSGARSFVEDRHDSRTCLSCGNSFWSEGPWNRRCPQCSEREPRLPKYRDTGFRHHDESSSD